MHCNIVHINHRTSSLFGRSCQHLELDLIVDFRPFQAVMFPCSEPTKVILTFFIPTTRHQCAFLESAVYNWDSIVKHESIISASWSFKRCGVFYAMASDGSLAVWFEDTITSSMLLAKLTMAGTFYDLSCQS